MSSNGPTAVRQQPDYPLQRTLVAGIFALIVAMGIGRFAYTPILPAMQERFGLTNASASALASSNYLGYLFGAILAAFVAAGRRQDMLLRASLLTAAVSTGLMALSTEFSVWLALRFLAGLASAGVLVLVSAVVLGELASQGRPELSGWFYSGVGLGVVLSGLVILPLNHLLTGDPAAWRADWLCLGTLAAILVAPCWVWLPKSGESTTPEAGPSGSGRHTARSSAGLPLSVVLLCVAYSLEGGGYIVTGTFLPAIVEGLPGLGGLGVGAWVLVGLAATPSTVLWAKVASHRGHRVALILAYAMQALGVALPVLSAAWWAAAVSAVLFGGTFMGIAALTLTYARRLVSAHRAEFALGALTAAFGAGQVLGPLVAAALTGGTGDFSRALLAASTAVTLGGLSMLFIGAFGRRAPAAKPPG